MAISRRRGMSLIECMVVMAVFAVFSTMVGHAVVLAYRSNAQTEEKVEARRQALTFLARLRREVAVRADCYPFDAGYANYAPVSATPANVTYWKSDGSQETAEYYLDPASETIYRRVNGAARPVCRRVKAFLVSNDPSAHEAVLVVKVATLNQPVVSTVSTWRYRAPSGG